MMHHPQRQSSTLLRSLNSSNSDVSMSNDCSSVLSIASRRCSPNRSGTPATSSFSTVSLCSRSSSSASTSSSCPILLSVFAWSVTLLMISACLDIADADELTGHRLGKRSYELQCKGTFDASIFARLNRICEDCYNLYRVNELYSLCMDNCFTSNYFKGCVDVLLMKDKIPEIKKWIMTIHGAAVPDY